MAPKVEEPTKPVPKSYAMSRLPPSKRHHYKVKDGDTWYSIAKEYGMEASTLMHFNFGTTDPAHINWYVRKRVCKGQPGWHSEYLSFTFNFNEQGGIIWIPRPGKGTARASAKQKRGYIQIPRPECPVKNLTCLTEEEAKAPPLARKLRGQDKFKRGTIVPSGQGERLVLSDGLYYTTFLMNGHYYRQPSESFEQDVGLGAYIEGTRRAKRMVQVSEYTLQVLLVVASGGVGVGAAPIVMTEVAKSASELDLPKLVKQLRALYAARKRLNAVAPILWEKLFWATIKRGVRELPGRLFDAVTQPSPEEVVELIGSLIGSLGSKVATKTLKTALRVIRQLVKDVLGFIKDKLKSTLGETAREKLTQQFAQTFTKVDPKEANEIANAIIEHKDTVSEVLEELWKVFKR